MSQSMQDIERRDIKTVTIPIRKVWEETGEVVFAVSPAVS